MSCKVDSRLLLRLCGDYVRTVYMMQSVSEGLVSGFETCRSDLHKRVCDLLGISHADTKDIMGSMDFSGIPQRGGLGFDMWLAEAGFKLYESLLGLLHDEAAEDC